MTQFLTRRELREAERKGLVVDSQNTADSVAELAGPLEVTPSVHVDSSVLLMTPAENPAGEISQDQINVVTASAQQAMDKSEAAVPLVDSGALAAPVSLTRRQLRELEQSGVAASYLAAPDEVAAEGQSDAGLSSVDSSNELPTAEEIVAIEEDAVDEELEAAEVDLDMPSADFTGTNLLAEPSTQSIILDIAPEAIMLSMETGEVAITGSIAILAEPATGSITGGLDGLALDSLEQQDAVTGVISVIEPISALSIINERANIGVVPQSVLRRGWWRNWLIGLAGILMAIAAILATITIINALGA